MSTIDGIARAYNGVAGRTSGLITDQIVEPAVRQRHPIEPDFDHLDALIWTLQRRLRSVLGIDTERALLRALDQLPDEASRLRTTLHECIDVIAALVQEAEHRHAGESGAGRRKLVDVERAVEEAIVARRPPFAMFPAQTAAPVAAAAGWVCDALVLLANRYELWGEPPAVPRPAPGRRALEALAAGRRALLLALARAIGAPARAAVRIARALERHAAPRVDEIELLQGRLPEPGSKRAAPPPLALRVVLDEQRVRLAGVVELVAYAVEIAGARARLGQKARASYAQKLVLLVLDDLGLPVLAGPMSPFARAATRGAVQVVERRLEQKSLVPRGPA